MKAELTRALVETRTLAQQHGWDRVEETVDTILEGDTDKVVIATAAGVEVGGIPRWVADTVPTLALEKTGIITLAAASLPVAAERMIVVFECGKLMSAEDVEATAQVCFSRPQGSYVIVMRGAEQIENAEDLEIVERGVFRLLVPDPKPEWNQQSLQQYSCYLWSDGAAHEFLADRLRRDKEALTAWLRRSACYADVLIAQQALYALEIAEKQRIEAMPEITPDDTLAPNRIYAALNDITELRRRLLIRIDAEAPSIERQLTASLLTMEQDLIQGARKYIAARIPKIDPSRDEAQLKTVIAEYISSAATRWKDQVERQLSSRSDAAHTDADAILNSIDWTVINRVEHLNGGEREYPDALLAQFASVDDLHLLSGASDAHSTLAAARQKKNTIAVGMLVATGVIARVSLTLGMGPVGLLASGATLILQYARYKEDSLRVCDEFAHKVIQATIRDAITAVQQQTREIIKPLRAHLTEEFRQLEERLDRALETSRVAGLLPPAEDSAHQAIEEIRRRVLALAMEDGACAGEAGLEEETPAVGNSVETNPL